jgi:septum site-determining protein MinC
LAECALIAVGVQGGIRPLQEAALSAGLPAMPAGRPSRVDPTMAPTTPPTASSAPGPSPTPTAAPIRPALIRAAVPEAAPARPAMVVNEPVRGGRQIYAAGGDLVVTAMVSAGAELLADGHIHVYGALRGRAVAGLSGDTNARIFCLSLEAEMVSIAGLYRVNEDIDRAIYRKSAQVYLKDGYLCLEPF